MKETPDRTLTATPTALPGSQSTSVPLAEQPLAQPTIEPIALRSFDRQHLIYDARVIDRARRPLWEVRGPRQIYVTEQHAHPINAGPGLVFTELVPSMHHFNGRGGRVLPLYRDAAGLVPNSAPGLFALLRSRLGTPLGPEDFLSYIAAVTAHPAYTTRFTRNLQNPGVRVPLTADPDNWEKGIRLGREVLWLHTFGHRCTDPGQSRPRSAPRMDKRRQPRVTRTIPDTLGEMPEIIAYEPATETLQVGAGQISPVPQAVWEYEVSGLKVVKHWFDYRKRNPGGKRTSPLDDINLKQWPARFTTELLEMLNVVGRCVELHSAQAELLERICAGPCITVAELEDAGVLPVPAAVRTHVAAPDDPTLL